MPKIFVEDTEIEIREKSDVDSTGHQINGKYYTMKTVITTDFKSTIFSYEDVSVLISKIERFGEMYYKVVLFSDSDAKAWQLVVLSAKLDIKIRRLNPTMFIVVGESNEADLLSQVSFCKMKPSTKVDEITLNFSKLNNLFFLGENSIVLEYDEVDDMRGEGIHVLSMYNYEGKLLKNFYEYADSDETKYSYELENNKIKIVRN